MTDIKRVHYATGQFLTAADFTREQTYHVTLRRMHNQNLHSWGVAAGLDVTKVDDTHVAVSAGQAIDAKGEDIVLLDPVTLDISAQSTAHFLYLIAAYQEVSDPADKVQIGGTDAYVAVTERPAFSFVDPGLDGNGAPNPPPADAVALALLTLDTGKVSAIQTTIRRLAGPAMGPVFNVQTLHAAADVVAAGTVNATGGEILFDGTAMAFDARTNSVGNASIQNSHISQTLEIYGFTNNDGSAGVGRNRFISMYDYVLVYGGMHIYASPDSPSRDGSVTIDGSLYVSGISTFSNTLFVQGALQGNRAVLHDLITITDITVSRNLQVSGDINVSGTLVAPKKAGLVMDRFINALADPLEIGDVVVIGATAPSLAYGPDGMIPVPEVDLTAVVADTRVCGVVCEVHGDSSGEAGAMRRFSDEERAAGTPHQVLPGQLGHMVVLGAYAFCKVDADIAAIAAGDLLTTSSTRGHAQKVIDRAGSIGAIVGKALAPLASGKGKIPVIVTLQ